MPLNAQFFAAIRSSVYRDGLSQQEVDSLNAIASVFDDFTGHDHCKDDLAYIMATAYRECGASLDMTIREVGRGAGKAYGAPQPPYNQVYYGRGPCQVTWLSNYQRCKTRLTADFVRFPDLMCDPRYGVLVMIDGMYAGLFTKYSLRSFITPGKPTTLAAFVQCRRIINGLDHAVEVANSAVLFQAALLNGYDAPVNKPPVVPSKPTQLPTQQRGLLADLLRLFRRSS